MREQSMRISPDEQVVSEMAVESSNCGHRGFRRQIYNCVISNDSVDMSISFSGLPHGKRSPIGPVRFWEIGRKARNTIPEM
mmetsp:Transcript_25638/g.61042  ORF Transcript_25638/g.61042 Transcript_25638/m.61042 type:complete len:81 (+) Transcript_25638:375-617(+)